MNFVQRVLNLKMKKMNMSKISIPKSRISLVISVNLKHMLSFNDHKASKCLKIILFDYSCGQTFETENNSLVKCVAESEK